MKDNVMNTETVSELLLKASPPVTISGLTFAGIDVPGLVQLGTLFYVLLMAVDKMYVLYIRIRDRQKAKNEDASKE